MDTRRRERGFGGQLGDRREKTTTERAHKGKPKSRKRGDRAPAWGAELGPTGKGAERETERAAEKERDRKGQTEPERMGGREVMEKQRALPSERAPGTSGAIRGVKSWPSRVGRGGLQCGIHIFQALNGVGGKAARGRRVSCQLQIFLESSFLSSGPKQTLYP